MTRYETITVIYNVEKPTFFKSDNYEYCKIFSFKLLKNSGFKINFLIKFINFFSV